MDVLNPKRTPFVLNLVDGLDYEDHPECKGSTFTMTRPATTPTGEVGYATLEKPLPGVLTWLGGETKAGLPEAIRQIPEFKRALHLGLLVVVEVKA